MSAYKEFEDTRVWQSTRDLVRQIYTAVSSSPVGRERVLSDGLKAQSLRISACIADAWEGRDDGVKRRILRDAQGAAAAVRAHAMHARDLELLSEAIVDDICERTMTIARQLGGWLRTMRESAEKRGARNQNESRPRQAAPAQRAG